MRVETNHLSTGTSSLKCTYLDGFDRVIQERLEAKDTYFVTDTEYDEAGNVD